MISVTLVRFEATCPCGAKSGLHSFECPDLDGLEEAVREEMEWLGWSGDECPECSSGSAVDAAICNRADADRKDSAA